METSGRAYVLFAIGLLVAAVYVQHMSNENQRIGVNSLTTVGQVKSTCSASTSFLNSSANGCGASSFTSRN
jgi:hypothetical protein